MQRCYCLQSNSHFMCIHPEVITAIFHFRSIFFLNKNFRLSCSGTWKKCLFSCNLTRGCSTETGKSSANKLSSFFHYFFLLFKFMGTFSFQFQPKFAMSLNAFSVLMMCKMYTEGEDFCDT